MAYKILRHKWQRIVLIVATTAALLVLLPALLLNLYWSPILAGKVKSAVLNGTDSLYKVSFKDAELHILQGKIVLYDINLEPDSAIYNKKKSQGSAPDNLYSIKVKKLVVTHMHPFSLYFNRKLNIGQIILSAPELKVNYRPLRRKDSTAKDNRTAWQRISKTLKFIHVGEILLNDVNFKYLDYSGTKPVQSELREMNLTAKDLLIDSATQTDRSRLLYCRDIVTELYNYTGKTPNGLYTYKFKLARLSTYSSRLDVMGLDVSPVQENVFFGKSGDDRMKLHLDTIQLDRFDYLAFHRHRTFYAAGLTLSGGDFSVYSNPFTGPRHTDRIITFPHVAIHQVKTAFSLGTLIVKRINIAYNQYNKAAKQSGTISFDHTSGRFYNITNNPDQLKKDNTTRADLVTYFMGKGRLNLNFNFNLTDAANSYSYRGRLGYLDLHILNKAIMPLALVKATSGQVNSMDFDVHSTNKLSTGTVKVLYSNLKINLLRRDTANGYTKKTLATFFANNAVLSRNNPDKPGDAARFATVNYVRPYNSPFFRTIWQTLLSGIKPCAGMGKAKEQQVMIQMTEHEKRKAARIKKRAEKKLKKAREKAEKQREKDRKKAFESTGQ